MKAKMLYLVKIDGVSVLEYITLRSYLIYSEAELGGKLISSKIRRTKSEYLDHKKKKKKTWNLILGCDLSSWREI